MAARPLSRSKLALVHVARKRLALDDDTYRAILARAAGVTSAAELDDHGFIQVMRVFAAAGFESDFAKANLGHREAAGMASPGEIAKIRELWAAFTDGAGDDASLGKWLEGKFKVSALRFLDALTARKAIGALVNMNRRKAAKVSN